MARPSFTKTVVGEVVNDAPPGQMNTFSTVADVNCDDRLDIIVCGRNGKMVWLQNEGEAGPWEQHLIDEVTAMECGGCLHDLTGNGFPDIINGGDWRSKEVSWWENPGVPCKKWQRRVVATTPNAQFHDTLIGDITGDGRVSLVFTNQQNGTTIYRVPLPKDPTISPWPGIEVVATGKREDNSHGRVQPEEGLAIGDIDGDGKNELVSGTHWYKHTGRKGDPWEEHKFASGYISTKIAIGDIDGDGRNEIVLSEGDPCIYGKPQGGKLAWFKPTRDIASPWDEHVVRDFLLDAHSLQLGAICGNSGLDIFVGEIGVADPRTDAYIGRPPQLIVFENDGSGNFTRHVIDEGTGTHEAVLADMRNRGVLDIVGKPLHGPEKWLVHVWYNDWGGPVR